MIVSWSRRLDSAVRALGVGTGGLIHVELVSGEPVMLTADGCPSRARSDPRPRAGTRTSTGGLELVADGRRLELRFDTTPVDEVTLRAPVADVATDDRLSVLVVATVDGEVYRLIAPLTDDDAAALREHEDRWLSDDRPDVPAYPAPLAFLGPVFTIRRLLTLTRQGRLDSTERDRRLTAVPVGTDRPPDAAFAVAQALHRAGEVGRALPFYQVAAAGEAQRTAALTAAVECLESIGAPRAADLARRWLAASAPTVRDKQLIYEAARRLERDGRTVEAALNYELLMSWDAAYEDTQVRLSRCHATPPPDSLDAGFPPPAPPTLAVVQDLDEQGLLPTTVESQSSFDAAWYHRFDDPAAADTAKKLLEMVGIFAAADLGKVGSSLDIGSGTMRYPQLLADLGVRSVGIDLQTDGVRGMPVSVTKHFVCADATRLPFRDSSFDLITCAMGTINHFAAEDRAAFFAECLRALAPGGTVAVSAWDPHCSFQTFLSLYSIREVTALRQRLVPAATLTHLARCQGFHDVQITPFAMFPDWAATSSHLHTRVSAWLSMLVSLDAAARDQRQGARGQMFLLTARRPAIDPTGRDAPRRRRPPGRKRPMTTDGQRGRIPSRAGVPAAESTGERL
jgi:SAM-dependent methyltransferase